MTDIPDLTETVTQALWAKHNDGEEGDPWREWQTDDIVREVTALHNKELTRLGYTTVKIGEPVPWMIGSVIVHAHELCDETCPDEWRKNDL